MTTPAFGRMLWKEYRALRGFWIGLLLLGLGWLWIAGPATGYQMTAGHSIAFAMMMPGFFALGAAASAFAGEREDGTIEQLRILSANPFTVASGKLIPTFAGAVLLSLLLLAWALLLARGQIERLQETDPASYFGCFTFCLELIAWGLFFSLLTRRTLTAIFLGATTAIAFALFVWKIRGYAAAIPLPPWMAPEPLFPRSFSLLESALSLRVGLAALLIVIDAVLATRWLSSDRTLIWPRRLSVERSVVLNRPKLSDSWHGRQEWKRLYWQEIRQGAPQLGFVAALSLVALVFMFTELFGNSTPLIAIAVPMLVAGSFAFHNEGHDRRFLFLSERGISPTKVWISKSVVWFAVPALILALPAVPILTSEFIGWPPNYPYQDSVTRLMPFLAVTAFICGQFASILFSRGTFAILVAIMLLLAIVFGSGLTAFWMLDGVPRASLLWPAPAALLIASYVRCRDWMLERNDRRTWLRTASPILLGMVVFVVGWIEHRANEIPAVPEISRSTPGTGYVVLADYRKSFDQQLAARGATAGPALENAKNLADVNARLHSNSKSPPPDDYLQWIRFEQNLEWEAIEVPSVHSFLVSNQTALREAAVLAHNRQGFCRPAKPNVAPGELSPHQFALVVRRLARAWMLESRRRLETEGFQSAVAGLTVQLDLAACAYDCLSVDCCLAGLRTELEVSKLLLEWSSSKSRTVADLELARWIIDSIQPPNALDDVQYVQRQDRTAYRIIKDAMVRRLEKRNKVVAFQEKFFAGWYPQSAMTSRNRLPAPTLVGKRNLPLMEALLADQSAIVDFLDNHWLRAVDGWAYPSRLAVGMMAGPWEKSRALRLVKRNDRDEINALFEFEQKLDEFGFVNQLQTPRVADSPRVPPVTDYLFQEWIRTTPMALLNNYPRSLSLAISARSRESFRRAAIIGIALCQWRAAKGKFPNSLDELLGNGLDSIPLDPVSGREFGYRPHGFPNPIKFTLPLTEVPANKPLLWVAGGNEGSLKAKVINDGKSQRVVYEMEPRRGHGMAFLLE